MFCGRRGVSKGGGFDRVRDALGMGGAAPGVAGGIRTAWLSYV